MHTHKIIKIKIESESESESEYLFNIIYAILINNLNNMVIQ